MKDKEYYDQLVEAIENEKNSKGKGICDMPFRREDNPKIIKLQEFRQQNENSSLDSTEVSSKSMVYDWEKDMSPKYNPDCVSLSIESEKKRNMEDKYDDYQTLDEDNKEKLKYGVLSKGYKKVAAFTTALLIVLTASIVVLQKDDIKDAKDAHSVVEVLNDEDLSYLTTDYLEFASFCSEAQGFVRKNEEGKITASLAQSEALEDALTGEYGAGSLMSFLNYCRAIHTYTDKETLTTEEEENYQKIIKNFEEYELENAQDYLLTYAKDRCINALEEYDNETFSKANFNKVTLEDHFEKGDGTRNIILSLSYQYSYKTIEKYRINVDSNDCIKDALDAYYTVKGFNNSVDYTDKNELKKRIEKVQKSIATVIVNDKNMLHATENKDGKVSLKESKTYIKNNTIYSK